jgi:hypothetical protein
MYIKRAIYLLALLISLPTLMFCQIRVIDNAGRVADFSNGMGEALDDESIYLVEIKGIVFPSDFKKGVLSQITGGLSGQTGFLLAVNIQHNPSSELEGSLKYRPIMWQPRLTDNNGIFKGNKLVLGPAYHKATTADVSLDFTIVKADRNSPTSSGDTIGGLLSDFSVIAPFITKAEIIAPTLYKRLVAFGNDALFRTSIVQFSVPLAGAGGTGFPLRAGVQYIQPLTVARDIKVVAPGDNVSTLTFVPTDSQGKRIDKAAFIVFDIVKYTFRQGLTTIINLAAPTLKDTTKPAETIKDVREVVSGEILAALEDRLSAYLSKLPELIESSTSQERTAYHKKANEEFGRFLTDLNDFLELPQSNFKFSDNAVKKAFNEIPGYIPRSKDATQYPVEDLLNLKKYITDLKRRAREQVLTYDGDKKEFTSHYAKNLVMNRWRNALAATMIAIGQPDPGLKKELLGLLEMVNTHRFTGNNGEVILSNDEAAELLREINIVAGKDNVSADALKKIIEEQVVIKQGDNSLVFKTPAELIREKFDNDLGLASSSEAIAEAFRNAYRDAAEDEMAKFKVTGDLRSLHNTLMSYLWGRFTPVPGSRAFDSLKDFNDWSQKQNTESPQQTVPAKVFDKAGNGLVNHRDVTLPK